MIKISISTVNVIIFLLPLFIIKCIFLNFSKVLIVSFNISLPIKRLIIKKITLIASKLCYRLMGVSILRFNYLKLAKLG